MTTEKITPNNNPQLNSEEFNNNTGVHIQKTTPLSNLKKHIDFVKKEALKCNDKDYFTAVCDMERVCLGYFELAIKGFCEEIEKRINSTNWQYFWFDGGQEAIIDKINQIQNEAKLKHFGEELI